tara:strand:+ start:1582 stop:2661 length:1080 start_codon:yes stop_codon:yes gene_type:complete
MANKDLFKQAIAEAKSVRSAAIANAKEALEETLTPHLKDMLAAKLQEMEEKDIDEDVVDEGHGDKDANEEKKDDKLKEDFTFEEESEEEADIDSEESEEEAEEEAEEEIEVKDMEVDDLKDLIRDIIAQEVGDEHAEDADELPADDMVAGEDEEEIDLDELLREISEMSDDDDEQHNEVAGIPGGLGMSPDNDLVVAAKKIAAAAKKAGTSIADFMKKHGWEVGSASQAMRREEVDQSEQLSEAVKTIKKLSSQLQEVNLLNAKLLYVNKVMKANNLTESQKVNIIAAFDKAETVKEAKLVFETVSNNLVSVPSRKRPVTESKLGMASKATGVTASKPEIISEVSDAVKRMQKLAGIIK